MRKRTFGAVAMTTLTLSIGVTGAAYAAERTGPEPAPVVGFTPPIGSEHGSVVAHSPMERAPTSFELDLWW